MDLVNDLGNDLALAALINKADGEKIDTKEILPLFNKIREILEPISAKDHSSLQTNETADSAVYNPLTNEATNSH